MDNQQLLDFYNEYLSYQEDGTFIWKKKRAQRTKIGDIAGSKNGHGYINIDVTIDGIGHCVKAHRLAFLLHHGWLPIEVDHEDTNRSNNRISNLREAVGGGNAHNASKRNDNTSGYKGVSWNNRNKKWIAYINVNRKRKYLGYFTCKIEAAKAYDKAARELHGAFARTNF